MKPYVTRKYLELAVQSSQQKILEVLFNHPDWTYSLTDLAKEAGVTKVHVSRVLENLLKLDLVTIEKLTKIWRIRANRQSWNFVKSKVVYNLNFIYQSGIVEFLNAFFKNPKSIILFGSFRNGEDISSSDVDIAIEMDEGEYQTIGLRELVEFEKVIGRRIQIHLFNRKDVDLHVFNNIANGIILYGFLEVNM